MLEKKLNFGSIKENSQEETQEVKEPSTEKTASSRKYNMRRSYQLNSSIEKVYNKDTNKEVWTVMKDLL